MIDQMLPSKRRPPRGLGVPRSLFPLPRLSLAVLLGLASASSALAVELTVHNEANGPA